MSFAWREILVVVIGTSVFAPLDLQAEDLDLRIAPAQAAVFAEIRDAHEWGNPVHSYRSNRHRSAFGCDSGRPYQGASPRIPNDAEIRLPVSAWPYGRVVAGQGASIAGRDDREAIARNRRAVEQILESLGVVSKLVAVMNAGLANAAAQAFKG